MSIIINFCSWSLDLTIGDQTGAVTTIRTSPLVTVVMEFEDLRSTLDLVADRKCPVGDDITLLWYDIMEIHTCRLIISAICFSFQVSPCFYYEAVHTVDVPEFG